jgi:hypothetical protein
LIVQPFSKKFPQQVQLVRHREVSQSS